ncbi:MAG TPA: hypothetical protein VM008_02855 [Phycisphaerae bacterium]|nr:hypothetical protein [Phycisphaerae bacterium]
MNSFFKFIMTLLVVGSTIAFGIVLLGDVRAARQQATDLAREKDLFADVVERFSGRQAHALIGVDWQKVDASQQVMETSLLVRNFTLGADGKEVALPIERVVIPRDRVCVQGLKLSFDDSFSEDYKDLRGRNLLYVHFIYADGGDPDKGLMLVRRWKVPRATQMHEDRATQFEMQLWQYLWELMYKARDARHGLSVNPEPGTWYGQASGTSPHGAGVTMTDAGIYVAARRVSNGGVYSVYVAADDGTTITENNDPALLPDMRREAAEAEELKSQNGAAPQGSPESN